MYDMQQRLFTADIDELREELYGHGYRSTGDNDGPFEMSPDSVFDTLLEYYEQFPEKDPYNPSA